MKIKVIIFIVIIFLLMFFSVCQAYEVKGNNPTLKALSVSVGKLDPSFDTSTIEYGIVVAENVGKVDITAIPNDENASVKISGNDNLKLGLNKINIEVTAENGVDKRIYTINVTKGDVSKTNANLSNIEINDGVLIPDFDKNIISYVVQRNDMNKKLNITAKPEDAQAKVSITDNTDIDNTIYVKCTASNGITTKTYMLTVIPGGENSNENIQNAGEMENVGSGDGCSFVTKDTAENTNDNTKIIKIFGVGVIILIIMTVILMFIWWIMNDE